MKEAGLPGLVHPVEFDQRRVQCEGAIELQRGGLDQVLVRGPQGYVVLMAAASGTMLLVLANREAKLGLIFLDMTKTVKDIARVL